MKESGRIHSSGMNEKESSAKRNGEHRTHHTRRHGLGRRVSVLAAFLLIAVCCTVFGSFLSSAHGNRMEEPVNFKYYKSITIEEGDTLWGIAEEYMTDDYESIREYVYALKKMNNLTTDEIKTGEKLIIAYNDTTFIR